MTRDRITLGDDDLSEDVSAIIPSFTSDDKIPTIIEAMEDADFWRPWFNRDDSWNAWKSFLKALFGLPLNDTDLQTFMECTGRELPIKNGFTEAWLVVGRRGGKSLILALIACYLAVFRDWQEFLTPGEVGYIKILSVDRKQARVIHRYCVAMLTQVPLLRPLVIKEDNESIELSNRVTIEIQTVGFRQSRGYTIIAALCDEIAFWQNENTAKPDEEVIASILPGMSSIPGAMLLCASSPYARRGELWNNYHRFYGKTDAPVLIWQAASKTMNPTIRQFVIDRALERDPAKNSAEYLAVFRTDIESYISREVIETAIMPGQYEISPIDGNKYVAFVDPSGGSSDSMTLCIAHVADKNAGIVQVDCVREVKPPFSPEHVVIEFSSLLKSYRTHRVIGDRYAGEWPRERFSEHGITYECSKKTKSDLYKDLLPLLNSGKVELIDNVRMLAQLTGLERRTARGGRDSIDHAPGSHDDIANAVAGAVVNAGIGNDTLAVWRKFADNLY